MPGYWKQPNATPNILDKDGWLRTGDIAKIDNCGFVYLLDRKKDIIIVSGFNVYPNEIENIICKCPGVAEVAAIGIPDENSGEAVKLFLVKSDNFLTEDHIKEFCRENLVAYKRPKKN